MRIVVKSDCDATDDDAQVLRKDESFSDLFDRLAEGSGSSESLKKLRGSVEFVDSKMFRETEGSRSERREPKPNTADLAGSGSEHSSPEQMKRLLDRMREEEA